MSLRPSSRPFLARRPIVGTLRRAAFMGCVAAVWSVSTVPTRAGDDPIVILTSSQIEAYQQAAAGARERVDGRRQKILTYTLNGDANLIPYVGDQLSLIAPKAVIAIGGLAATALATRPIDAPVVVSVVVDHTNALSRVPHSWAVSMHVPAEEAYDRISRILPKRRIGIPYDPSRTGWLVRDLAAFFDSTPIDLVPFPVESSQALGPALLAVRARIDALWIIPDPSFLDPVSVEYLLRYAVGERLPLIGYSEGFTRSGALFSLGADYQDMGRQAGELIEAILADRQPSRVVHPRRLQTFLNTTVAARLDISLTPALIRLAQRVFPAESP